LRLTVRLHHLWKIQARQQLLFHRHADDAAGVPDHERDGFGSGPLGGHDQIAFVLAILVIDDDHHAPGFEIRDDLIHRIEPGAGAGGALAPQRNDVGHGVPQGCSKMTLAPVYGFGLALRLWACSRPPAVPEAQPARSALYIETELQAQAARAA